MLYSEVNYCLHQIPGLSQHQNTILKDEYAIEIRVFFLLRLMDNQLKRLNGALFLYTAMAVRILYTQKWKYPTIPPTEEWLEKMLSFVAMAKLIFALKKKVSSLAFPLYTVEQINVMCDLNCTVS